MALDGGGLPASRISYVDYEGLSCSMAGLPAHVRTNLSRASHVVFGSGVSSDGFACVEQLIAEVSQHANGQILLIGLKNFGWNNNAIMRVPAAARGVLRVPVLPHVRHSNTLAAAHAAQGGFAPARYVDVLALVADDQGRVPVFTPEGRLISQDRYHLTKAGAAYLGQLLFAGPVHDMVAPRQR